MFATVLPVAIGGAIGATARYLTGVVAVRVMGHGFPWGTMTVNIVGSFLLGVIIVYMAERSGHRLAPFLVTGILGSYTTFSSFSLDALVIYERGQIGIAAAYVTASVMLSLGAIFAGLVVARNLL
ncbi:MAG: fluoride efflux transporter CrcB [Paracoccaceae bacterium]